MAPRPEKPWREIAQNDIENPDVQQRLAENPNIDDLSPEMRAVVEGTERDVVDLDLE